MNDDTSWIIRVKNPTLFKAAINLFCVRQAAGELPAASEQKIGLYEMKMLSEAINAIRDLSGGQWEKFPLPSYGDDELATYNPLPHTIFRYCDVLLHYLYARLSDLDR